MPNGEDPQKYIAELEAKVAALTAELERLQAERPRVGVESFASSFTTLLEGLQAQAARPTPSGIAAALRSIDVEVKGYVEVQDNKTQLAMPRAGETIEANSLSLLRLSFVTVPTPMQPAPTTFPPPRPPERAVPVSEVSGIGPAFTQRLVVAQIDTIEKLLTLDAERLAQILRTTSGRAASVLEAARRGMRDRPRRST